MSRVHAALRDRAAAQHAPTPSNRSSLQSQHAGTASLSLLDAALRKVRLLWAASDQSDGVQVAGKCMGRWRQDCRQDCARLGRALAISKAAVLTDARASILGRDRVCSAHEAQKICEQQLVAFGSSVLLDIAKRGDENYIPPDDEGKENVCGAVLLEAIAAVRAELSAMQEK